MGLFFPYFLQEERFFLLLGFQVVLKTRVKLHVDTENLEEYFNFGEPVLLVINSNY